MPVAVPLAMAAAGAIGGALKKGPKAKDLGQYAPGYDREQSGKDASGQIHGMYQNDPGTFWGQDYGGWSDRAGMGQFGPPGGLSWGDLTGGGGGFSRASSGGGAASIDMNEDIYQMEMPDAQYQRLMGQLGNQSTADANEQTRMLTDQATMGGSASSPAMLSAVAQARREAAKAKTMGGAGARSEWFTQAGGRRHEGLSTNAQLKEAAMQRAMQASAANAAASAGANSAAAGRRAQAAQMMLGMYESNQDRDLQRYAMLNDMNMGWQRPVNQKQMVQPSGGGWQGALGGAAQGFSSGGGMGSIGSMFGGGAGGGGAPGPWAGQYGGGGSFKSRYGFDQLSDLY